MALSSDQVNGAYTSIASRCQSAIDNLESKKSVLGWATGNNDSVEQTQGALRMILNNQLGPWKQNGLDLVAQGDNADPAKIKGWASVGDTFTTAITKIDGYGQDATIQAVLAATAAATGQQLADQVPNIAIGIGAVGAVVVVAVIGYFVLMSKARQAAGAPI